MNTDTEDAEESRPDSDDEHGAAPRSSNKNKRELDRKAKGKRKGETDRQDAKDRPDIGEDPEPEERIREAHYETFPASDPPSFTPEK